MGKTVTWLCDPCWFGAQISSYYCSWNQLWIICLYWHLLINLMILS